MTFNPIQHEATTSQQREDTAETCHRWSPSKGLTVQEMALSPSAPVDIRRLVTPWQAAGLAAAAAALTFALTVVVIDDRDASRAAVQPDTPTVMVPAHRTTDYGTADAAEHWLTTKSPEPPTMHYGTADAAEHWLTSAQPH